MSNLIKTISALTEVSKVAEWNGRYYVNFVGADRGCAGDRNLKIWIKDDVLTIEPMKGSLSTGALRGLNQVTDLTEKAEKIAGHISETAGAYRF
jgi:hypothetical protein